VGIVFTSQRPANLFRPDMLAPPKQPRAYIRRRNRLGLRQSSPSRDRIRRCDLLAPPKSPRYCIRRRGRLDPP
jgi:hypothetical protein